MANFFSSALRNLPALDAESACLLLTRTLLRRRRFHSQVCVRDLRSTAQVISSPGGTPRLINADENLITHRVTCHKTSRGWPQTIPFNFRATIPSGNFDYDAFSVIRDRRQMRWRCASQKRREARKGRRCCNKWRTRNDESPAVNYHVISPPDSPHKSPLPVTIVRSHPFHPSVYGQK